MSGKPWMHTICCGVIALAGLLYPLTNEQPPAWLVAGLIVLAAFLLAAPMWLIWAFDQYQAAVDDYLDSLPTQERG